MLKGYFDCILRIRGSTSRPTHYSCLIMESYLMGFVLTSKRDYFPRSYVSRPSSPGSENIILLLYQWDLPQWHLLLPFIRAWTCSTIKVIATTVVTHGWIPQTAKSLSANRNSWRIVGYRWCILLESSFIPTQIFPSWTTWTTIWQWGSVSIKRHRWNMSWTTWPWNTKIPLPRPTSTG